MMNETKYPKVGRLVEAAIWADNFAQERIGFPDKGVLMKSPDVASILQDLVREHVADRHSEQELLLWMLLLHNYRIRFNAPVAQGFPDPTVLYPSTQRMAAEVVAGIWPDEQDQQKRDYRHWYHAFVVQYGGPPGIPVEARTEIETMRTRLLADKRVLSVDLE
jgi:hypothetical protein